jgi:hypothetical protein
MISELWQPCRRLVLRQYRQLHTADRLLAEQAAWFLRVSELTKARGVSFNIVSRLLCTSSGLPVRHTLVTCPLTRFGSEDLTCASIGKGPFVISLHSFLKLTTFVACTGSSWIGTSSGASSGCVHRRTASAVAYTMSSVFGPARSEANGTLKE